MKKALKKCLAIGLSFCFLCSDLTTFPIIKANADSSNTVTLGKGSYSTVTKGKQVYSEEAGLVDRTTEQTWWPKRSIAGNVYVTDNITGAIPTNDWATSFLWGTMYGGVSNPFSEPAYAFPLAYKASSEGMYLTQAPVHMVTQSTGALDYCMPLQPGYIDLAVKPSAFTPSNAKVDKVTDWAYDIVMEDGNKEMKTIMSQGSPYAYFECENTDLEIVFKRGTRMSLVQGNANNTTIVVKVLDNKENDWNYYALFGPAGVTWNFTYSSTDCISKITADLPDEKGYMSIAILPDESTDYVDLYETYAYNFISDTKAEWSYDDTTSVLTTTYTIQTENKAESTVNGTILGVLPHQYKHSFNGNYLDITYKTVRGTMKLLCTSSYQTKLSYSGILPFMPQVNEEDEDQLRSYLNEYMEKNKNNATPYLYIYEGTGDTYWTGKALNNLVNVLAVAEELGETEKADILLDALKGVLEDWFSTNDTEQDNYFYYDREVGTLVGYPSSYGADTQLNDHHFHYGYWIYAAAQVALRDPEWAEDSSWGAMVKELIGDIASTDRSNERYPYLRNFAPYEGHSWASGPQLFTDGNNQESSSEAINAWAGIILFGEATGNTALRDLGIYLYTTEISAVENYWFDLDKDVLSPQFRYRDRSATEYDPDREEVQTQASMVWGGKYIYGTWWSAEPLQVQGINLLPVTGASLYLAKDKDYIIENYKSARKLEDGYTGSDKLANPYDRWNDIWHEYVALADPELALANWSPTADEEGGESRAHTYHYMKSLQAYGTPDVAVTSDATLSAVFSKDGIKTYTAFNPTDNTMTVHYSDGAVIKVVAHSMYAGADGTNNLGEAGILVSENPSTTEETTTSPEVSNTPEVQPTATVEPSATGTIKPSNTPEPSSSSEQIFYFNSFSYLKMESETAGKIVFLKDVSWVDVHYETQGTQQNFRMLQDNGIWYLSLNDMPENGSLSVSFTYYDNSLGYALDSEWESISYCYNASGNTENPATTATVTQVPSVALAPVSPEVASESPAPSTSDIPSVGDVKPAVSLNTLTSSCISQNYLISSQGSEPVQLSKLSVRYYYDRDGKKPQTFWCDNAGLQLTASPWYLDLTNNIIGVFYDGYLELTFQSDQLLYTNAGYLNISLRFAQSDWSSYVNFKDNGCKLYYDGKLVN